MPFIAIFSALKKLIFFTREVKDILNNKTNLMQETGFFLAIFTRKLKLESRALQTRGSFFGKAKKFDKGN